MNWRFWKKESDWCPLFRGLGSHVVCLIRKTPELVACHCKQRKHPCPTIVRVGYPDDVKLRKSEYRHMNGGS